MDRRLPRVKTGDPLRVDVDHGHVMPHARKTRGGDKADIAGAEDGDFHGRLPLAASLNIGLITAFHPKGKAFSFNRLRNYENKINIY
jgi:hypothetical protein